MKIREINMTKETLTPFANVLIDTANTFMSGPPYNPDEALTFINLGYARKQGKTLDQLNAEERTLPVGWEWHNLGQEDGLCTESNKIEFYAAVNHSQKKLCIIIPGTDNRYDIIKDLHLLRGDIDETIPGKIINKWKDLQNTFYSEKGSFYDTVVYGHSLGSSIGEMTGLMINNDRLQQRCKPPTEGTPKNTNPVRIVLFENPGVPTEISTPLKQGLKINGTVVTPDPLDIINVQVMPNAASALNPSSGSPIIKVCPIIFDLIQWHTDRINRYRTQVEQERQDDAPTKTGEQIRKEIQIEKAGKKSETQLSMAFLWLHSMMTYGDTTKELLEKLYLYPTDDENKINEIDALLLKHPPSLFYRITRDDWNKWSKHYRVVHQTTREAVSTPKLIEGAMSGAVAGARALCLAAATGAEVGRLAAENPLKAAGALGVAAVAGYLGGGAITDTLHHSAREKIKKEVLTTVLAPGMLTANDPLFATVRNRSYRTEPLTLRTLFSAFCCCKKAPNAEEEHKEAPNAAEQAQKKNV